MKCLNCSKPISLPDNSRDFFICPSCSMLHMVCSADTKAHLRPPHVSYCPICKEKVSSSYGQGLSSFSRSLVKADSKLVLANSVPLVLGSVKNLFCFCYDLFLIVISDKGKGVVIREDEVVHEFDLNKLFNASLEKIEPYSGGVLLFNSSGHVYRMAYSSIFATSPGADQLTSRCKVSSFDPLTNTLVYYENGIIHRLNVITQRSEREATDYLVRSILYCAQNLFYIGEKQRLYTLVVKSFDTGTQSEKTSPHIKGDGSILAIANERFLAFSTRNQGETHLWSGAWKHLSRKQSAWTMIPMTSAANKLVLKDDSLYIQYLDKIELKDCQGLQGGVMNTQTEVQGLVPGSLEVSQLSDQISYQCVQANQTYTSVLANGFAHKNFQSRGLNSRVIAQAWYNNRLAFIAKENNSYVYIREMMDE